MDPRRLKTFVAVADTLHFGRAAERLHIAQPAVTQQIQLLERELEVTLFDRRTRSVRLTPVGEEFLVESRKALAQIERTELVAKRAKRGEIGKVEISHVSSIAYSGLLSRILVEAQRVIPDVSLGVRELDLEVQLQNLDEGRIDIALVRLPTGPLPSGVVAMTLRRERVVACLRRDHPLAGAPVDVASLAGEAFIGTHLREGFGFFDAQLRICRAAGFEPNIVSRSHQFVTIISLVAAGRGVALVPEPVSRLSFPDVVYLPLRDCPIASEIALAYRYDGASPAANRMVDLCAQMRNSGAFRN